MVFGSLEMEFSLNTKAFYLVVQVAKKILTWDNYLKRRGNGPNVSNLCMQDGETITHMFVHCTYLLKWLGRNSNLLFSILVNGFPTLMNSIRSFG